MSSQGGIGSFLPLIIMIVAAWFLLIRPQQLRQKQQAQMLSELEIGAEIVTIGGIFGTIVSIGEERVRIAVADGSQLEIARQSVRSIISAAEPGSTEDESDTTAESDVSTVGGDDA